CPCAVVISVPLSFVAGIGAASKRGILVKGSNYIEKMNDADLFVFDKTGTLTKGNFAVSKVYPEDKREEVLKIACNAEVFVNHPIALSIVKSYGKKAEEGFVPVNHPGEGIEAVKGGDRIICGNVKLMRKFGVKPKICDEPGTVVYVAKNGKFAGYILVADEIKPEAKKVIGELGSMGARAVMLTGDNEKVAASVAEEIGLTEYKASLMPQDKVNEVEKMLSAQGEKRALCFVGDGINDAPVLMRADVGIAMGGVGSDAAIEASDIVLMNDDLKALPVAKKIAKKTMRIVYENVWFSIGIKIAILVLSALRISNMWIAVFGDVGVAVLAILNAMRANSKAAK
ncbi:MAG: HAD-IC family P-type ATPase, partial [Clostridia bacterium]|nr:HAD-IC family P-type ATPase [Clostridia bacterium]